MGSTKFIPPGPHSTSGSYSYTQRIGVDASQPSMVFDRTSKEHPSEIVEYEIRMFRFTYAEVMRLHSDETQKELCNALFESYLIHYRGLLELFIARRREDGRPNLRDEDLSITRARSWFGRDLSAEEIEALDTDAIKLRILHNRIGKYLAHLSEPRATEGMTWAVPEMHELLDALLRRLVALREQSP
ncbi:MAG: hypothetical protein JWP01_3950 [Myxococcales bacterium]|nr:hypothetical protein [Myxococcales bacterium]